MGMATAYTGSVEEWGKCFGYRKNAAYAAVKRGQLPVITIGGKSRVTKPTFEKMLGQPIDDLREFVHRARVGEEE